MFFFPKIINLKKVSFPKSSTLITRSSQCAPPGGPQCVAPSYTITQGDTLGYYPPKLPLGDSHSGDYF